MHNCRASTTPIYLLVIALLISGQGFSTSVTEQAAPNELETTTPSDGADEVSVEDSTTNKVTTADHASDAFKDEYGVENRVINGKSAVNAEMFPYQVSLQKDGYHFCGGVIYKANWIITAGHCCAPVKAADMKAYAGITQVSSSTYEGQGRDAERHIIHPNYPLKSGPMAHDICLVKLKKPFNLNYRTVGPVNLPKAYSDPSGSLGVLSGWGATFSAKNPSDRHPVNELQYAVLTIVDHSQCIKKYVADPKRDPNKPTASDICAGDFKTSACQGDSGGPLVLAGGSDVLVGIVSRGPGRMCDRATVFTSVSHYVDWIHKVIKKYDGKKRSGK